MGVDGHIQRNYLIQQNQRMDTRVYQSDEEYRSGMEMNSLEFFVAIAITISPCFVEQRGKYILAK